MYNINYCLMRLFYSPVFPYLPIILGISLFISSKYFEPTYLCEGENLEQLKTMLSEETIKYNEAIKRLDDLVEEMKRAEQDEDLKRAFHYDLESEFKADDICEIFYKIRGIEESIKDLDKSFISSIKKPDFA